MSQPGRGRAGTDSRKREHVEGGEEPREEAPVEAAAGVEAVARRHDQAHRGDQQLPDEEGDADELRPAEHELGQVVVFAGVAVRQVEPLGRERVDVEQRQPDAKQPEEHCGLERLSKAARDEPRALRVRSGFDQLVARAKVQPRVPVEQVPLARGQTEAHAAAAGS